MVAIIVTFSPTPPYIFFTHFLQLKIVFPGIFVCVYVRLCMCVRDSSH